MTPNPGWQLATVSYLHVAFSSCHFQQSGLRRWQLSGFIVQFSLGSHLLNLLSCGWAAFQHRLVLSWLFERKLSVGALKFCCLFSHACLP